MSKTWKPIKAPPEVHDKLMNLTLKLSDVQGVKIGMHETIRRAFKISNVEETLIKDAEIKKRSGLK